MRLIDADALLAEYDAQHEGPPGRARALIESAPTVNGWISVKDGLPTQHDSLFAKLPKLGKFMWAKESYDVIVYVAFPDGTGRATEGRLRDGMWNTKISPTLEPVITHWMPFPERPKKTE